MTQLYMIERSIAGDGQRWVRSDSFPDAYSMGAAQRLLDKYPRMLYRIAGIPRKAYRRHAAKTPLELRGALAMLQRACKQLLAGDREFGLREIDAAFEAYKILSDAMLRVTRELEAL